jgi:hypothetical protein
MAAATRLQPKASATSRRRLRLPRHRSTTASVCSIYPCVIQAPLPPVGPLLGEDLTAGESPLHWDPFEIYDHGLVTNPNVFVMGEPGFAKSSLIKCWAVWQNYIYGDSLWLTITDPKGEYRSLAEPNAGSLLRGVTPQNQVSTQAGQLQLAFGWHQVACGTRGRRFPTGSPRLGPRVRSRSSRKALEPESRR